MGYNRFFLKISADISQRILRRSCMGCFRHSSISFFRIFFGDLFENFSTNSPENSPQHFFGIFLIFNELIRSVSQVKCYELLRQIPQKHHHAFLQKKIKKIFNGLLKKFHLAFLLNFFLEFFQK